MSPLSFLFLDKKNADAVSQVLMRFDGIECRLLISQRPNTIRQGTFACVPNRLYNEGEKEACTMRKQKYYLYLNDAEQRIVLHSLIRLKNRLIQEGRYTDIVDEVIVKLAEAPKKRVAV